VGSRAGHPGLKRLLAALLWLAVPAAAQDVLPGLRGGVRVPADLDHGAFRALLRVQTELGVKCTGFMVAPAIAMTAAHCLYLGRVGRFIQPGSVHVLLGYRLGAYRAHARVRRFVIASGYDPVAAVPSGGRVAVRVAAYDQDRAEIALASPPCALTGSVRDATGAAVLTQDCSITHGASGAPLVAVIDGHDSAVGMVVAGAAASNLAVPLK
jgi:protease YdgD